MCLPTGAVEVELAEREAALLDRKASLVALAYEPGFDLRLVVVPGSIVTRRW